MSRVFVSCAHRDRAVGQRLVDVLRILGHQPLDDRNDDRGTAWWNEVVHRIETCDVFLAVVTPAYRDAQVCQLAVRHVAASGVRVVRVDLGDGEVIGCHPVLAGAPRVRFEPDADIWAVARLGAALESPGSSAPTVPANLRRWPKVRWPTVPRLGSVVGAALVVTAVALVAARVAVGNGSGHGVDHPSAAPSSTTASSTAASSTTASSTAPSVDADAAAGVQDLLARILATDSAQLEVSSCRAGAREVVCTRPDIRTVVLTSYVTRTELYAAYVAEVAGLAGGPPPVNAGDCTRKASEGEVAWNLVREHRLDIPLERHERVGLDPVHEAAGRVFCTARTGVPTMAWTEDPGLLVTVSGKRASDVVAWWQEVHLELACAARGSGVDVKGCAGFPP